MISQVREAENPKTQAFRAEAVYDDHLNHREDDPFNMQ